ncbi:hypothetical protein ACLB1G_13600 [Oxalobacteraceae bacterium A2-2]
MAVRVLEVVSLGGPMRWLLPVQSWSQGLSYAACLLIGAGLLKLFVGIDQPVPWLPCLLGAVVGSSAFLAAVLPAHWRIDIDNHEAMDWAEGRLRTYLQKQGYHPQPQACGIYVPRLPRLLRWRENVVQVQKSEMGLAITGPVFILRILRGMMLRELAAK